MNISTNVFSIKSDSDYSSLDDFCVTRKISKKLFNKLYRSEKILVNDELRRKSLEIYRGDIITLIMDEEEENEIPREDISLDIIYEDMDILVIDKPPFMPVHTTRYHQSGTLSNGVSSYFYNNNIDKKVRIVNRLDSDTSGIMLIAKSQHIDHQLSLQFKERRVVKKYLALVEGIIVREEGIIKDKILKVESTKKLIDDRGKEALTIYRVLERFDDMTLVEVEIPTGRSHQIRIHFSHIGHPILGDELYGSSYSLERQALHSSYIKIYHPRLDKFMEFKSDLPEDIKSIKMSKSKILKNLKY